MEEVIKATISQSLMLAGPLLVAGVLLCLIERYTTRMLMQRFGWQAVMVTGWVGTPVHELSHAAACVIFRHRIIELKLWAPDEETGTLGYVRHEPSDPKHWYQRLGAPIIGIAPLLGGSLVLAVLTFTMVPSLHGESDFLNGIEKNYTGMLEEGSIIGAFTTVGKMFWSFRMELFQPSNMEVWHFWLYLYLAVCVGMHMAPSGQDLRNAWKGLALLVVAVFVVLFGINLVFYWLGWDLTERTAMVRLVAPVMALLILAIILNTATLSIVKVLHIIFAGRKVKRTDANNR